MIYLSLLFSLLLSVAGVQAAAWTPEDTVEVAKHWRPIFEYQNEKGEFDNYITTLLDITEVDAEVASQIFSFILEHDAFKNFVEKKNLDATISLIEFAIGVLQRTIWDECTLKFPPQLAEVPQDMQKSGLTEQEYLTKLRRAFLVFTLIVTQMDQVVSLDQLA